jgi:predicted MFS family arabinose efflux permease
MSADRRGLVESSGRQPYRWFVLALLCLVYVLNFVDRQLLAILAKPIQDDLRISDGQLGLLGGLYFAIFYCVIAIPVAWLADRANRVRVLSIACALWSAATIACGLAGTYTQLAAARMAVGVGEAGGVPPSYSIIADYFPAGQRGRALGLFNLGPPIGQAIGVAFGAAIATQYDWRTAFMTIGAIGIAVSGMVWVTVREPRRGAQDQPIDLVETALTETVDDQPLSLADATRAFVTHPTLMLAALAAGTTQFVTYAILNFNVLFLMREKGMALEQVSIWYALVLGVAVSAGIYASGALTDRIGRRARSAYAWVPAAGLALALLPFAGFVAAPGWPVALAFLAGPLFFNFFYLTPVVALVQDVVPARQRTLASALLLLVMNLIGLGLGPTFLGLASDHFRSIGADNPLQLAFYSLIPFQLLAIVLFLTLARRLRRIEAGNTP